MRPLADVIANAAHNILRRMETFSPTEKIEILALMQTMVSIEVNREQRAKVEAQLRPPLPANAVIPAEQYNTPIFTPPDREPV